ncbi:hypothetical protein EPI10_015597 [Gossypium australe]|uniref:Uncharacterized protein n=1 Tax=Gossypium australe TaxID=47621 RepID=A0A5B6VLB0_9ROSI|nr:hypothetical protein EPI10_015597 [Gossypium australe]
MKPDRRSSGGYRPTRAMCATHLRGQWPKARNLTSLVRIKKVIDGESGDDGDSGMNQGTIEGRIRLRREGWGTVARRLGFCHCGT